MNVGLPGMSGYEVAKALREAGTAAQLFAVSGYAQPEDVKRPSRPASMGTSRSRMKIEDVERLLT